MGDECSPAPRDEKQRNREDDVGTRRVSRRYASRAKHRRLVYVDSESKQMPPGSLSRSLEAAEEDLERQNECQVYALTRILTSYYSSSLIHSLVAVRPRRKKSTYVKRLVGGYPSCATFQHTPEFGDWYLCDDRGESWYLPRMVTRKLGRKKSQSVLCSHVAIPRNGRPSSTWCGRSPARSTTSMATARWRDTANSYPGGAHAKSERKHHHGSRGTPE